MLMMLVLRGTSWAANGAAVNVWAGKYELGGDGTAVEVELFGECSLRGILRLLALTLPDGTPPPVFLDKPGWLCFGNFPI